jgi:hypothetical protein
MKTTGTDGRTHIIDPSKNVNHYYESSSELHIKARKIIEKCLPYSTVYEEVTLFGCIGVGGSPLRADFLIPDIGIIIEVHGQQHYKYVKHFHSSETGFEIYKKNDEIKLNWAKMNRISYIALPYNEIKKWENLINDRIG